VARTKGVENEVIIAALLQNGTMKEAAAAAGVSPRTIYDRMKDNEFRSEYMTAKNDVMRKAVFSMNEKLAQAVDTIAEIMTNKDNNPAIRLQAAQTLMNNAGKYSSILQEKEYAAQAEGKTTTDKLEDLIGFNF
jgi:hypothetical protein